MKPRSRQPLPLSVVPAAPGILHIRTRRGIRMTQHGTILSETCRRPGATGTGVDLLAALVAVWGKSSPIAMLGFAGGSIVAPLRALNCQQTLEAIDVDNRGFPLFQRLCQPWAGQVNLQVMEATQWLRLGRKRYSLIIEDLSIADQSDIITPELVWSTLPRLMKARLTADGVAVFNLLKPATLSWKELFGRVTEPFSEARVVLYHDFENRVVIAGRQLPCAGELSRRVRLQLRRINSRLADRIAVRSIYSFAERTSRGCEGIRS